jgi:orsellinic acid C2-O-methyltransferase
MSESFDLVQSETRLATLINAAWTTQTLYAACVLKVPDYMVEGARDVAALAESCQTDPGALLRLLRALISLDICVEASNGAFQLTETGRMLCSDHPRSWRNWALMSGGSGWVRWGELTESVRTGESYRARHGAENGFAHLGEDVEQARQFHGAMQSSTRRVAEAVRDAMGPKISGCLVDIGGGAGELLAHLLNASPNATGVVFDLPHAMEMADTTLKAYQLDKRVCAHSGSFFESVPIEGDIYLLKSILHDWDDTNCVRILRVLAQHMKPSARVWIIERLMSTPVTSSVHDQQVARSDLNMLVAQSGRERTLAAYNALFAIAGFRSHTVVATRCEFSVVELVRAENVAPC